MKRATFLLTLLLLTAVGFTAVACSNNEEEPITVADPWGRTSPSAAANGAFYMMLTNNSNADDTLLTVSTDACGVVELHEMYDKGDGVMGMRPIEGSAIPVPAGESAELKPGGMHVMCMMKQIQFEEGSEIPITLTFENAGEMEITAVIRDN
ncbi:copper chaperone PCu(A)C [Candidatus Leptofilum sp.]|uniref:copper chaperone PCu(A)C n=1 Tax=Candidatus Leptofilum sp. TaxID=3241576 RepID=UPI003B5B795E